MRKQINFIALAVVIFVAGFAVHAQTRTDLSMREALYFTGSNSTAIDLKNDKYVVKGTTLTITSGIAKSCDKGGCEFNMGFIGFRSGDLAAQLSSYGLISVDGVGVFGNTLYFAPSASTKQQVVPVKLKFGTNRLSFTIDPYKKTQETNEANNTFSVAVVVNR